MLVWARPDDGNRQNAKNPKSILPEKYEDREQVLCDLRTMRVTGWGTTVRDCIFWRRQRPTLDCSADW